MDCHYLIIAGCLLVVINAVRAGTGHISNYRGHMSIVFEKKIYLPEYGG